MPLNDNLPTLRIRAALRDLLRRNGRTHDREVGEMYLGPDIFIVRLSRPRVIEGQWTDTARTVDLFDLMDDHTQGRNNL